VVNGKFKILAIDGGGVRGIIPARMLQYIEDNTGKLIFTLFDMIVGTSTGGLIALGLTAPSAALSVPTSRFKASDLVNFYLNYSKEIFPQSVFNKVKTGFGLWSAKYPREPLDGILKTLFENIFLHDALKPVMVPSYSLITNTPTIFKSNRPVYKANQDQSVYLMSDIAGATTAAPTYFAPKVFTDNLGTAHMEIDGGVFANNPEELAIGEALRMYPELKREDIDVLSLGTGMPKLTPPKSYGVLGWISNSNIIDVMLNAGSLWSDKESSMICYGTERLQFDIAQGMDEFDNSSPEYLQSLLDATISLLASERPRLDKIITSLLPK
jgi:patatin-like phospholipase/acyl hydrolase